MLVPGDDIMSWRLQGQAIEPRKAVQLISTAIPKTSDWCKPVVKLHSTLHPRSNAPHTSDSQIQTSGVGGGQATNVAVPTFFVCASSKNLGTTV